MSLYQKERLHKAQRDSQSALSYWPGRSIAGATKHIPGYASVPVPTKTALNSRVEKTGACLLNQELTARAMGSEAQPTSYTQQYVVDPRHDYTVDPRQGHRGTEAQQLPAPLLEPKSFLGESTYQAQLARSSSSSSSSPGRGQLQVAVPAVKPGYLTQYAAASLPLQQKLGATVGAAAGVGDAGSEGSPRVGGGQGMPAAGAGPAGSKPSSLAGACNILSRFDGDTTYGKMYRAGSPGNATEELNKGTPKSSLHLPGYGGHVPSEADLILAGLSSRVKKEDSLLFHLDQHSRGLVPGYTGHKPAHKAAVRLDAPAPTTASTQGAAHQEALRWRDQAAPATAINSRAGVLSFFSSGSSPFVSENGLAEAALFHKNRARPYEGLMKIPHSSATNRYGAKFAS